MVFYYIIFVVFEWFLYCLYCCGWELELCVRNERWFIVNKIGIWWCYVNSNIIWGRSVIEVISIGVCDLIDVMSVWDKIKICFSEVFFVFYGFL